MKKILIGLMTLVLVVGLVGAGAFAYFSDVETSEGNTFTAGTLDLQIDADPTSGGETWVDDLNVPTVNQLADELVSNMKPGDQGLILVGVKNAGTIDGVADIHFILVSNNENGVIEPEAGAPLENGGGPGELAQSINVDIDYNGVWLYTGTLESLNCQNLILGPLPTGETATISILMWINTGVGNEIQGDSCKVDVEFSLNQS